MFHQYIEKLDLSGFISVTDDTTRDCNSEEARFNLRMKNGNIKFTVRGICINESIFLSKVIPLFFFFLTVFISSVVPAGPNYRSSWSMERLYPICGSGRWSSHLFHSAERVRRCYYNADFLKEKPFLPAAGCAHLSESAPRSDPHADRSSSKRKREKTTSPSTCWHQQ